MGAYDDLLADVPAKKSGSYDDLLSEANKPEPSLKDKIYKAANKIFQPSSVINEANISTQPTGFDNTGAFERVIQNNTIPNNLQAGSKIVDGLTGIAEVGGRKGYAGLGRIEAGAIKALADVLGSETLSDVAKSQQEYANQIESGAVLRGKPIEGFAKESIVQDLPGAASNAISSIITTAPSLAAGAIAPELTLPAMFATTGAQEYGQGRESGLNPAGAALRAIPQAALEVIGEKVGGTGQLADALHAAAKGNGLANLGSAMVGSAIKELPGEELTTTGQFLVDKAPGVGTNQEAGINDYGKQVKDTALATLLQSGAMAGGGHVLNTIADRTQSAPVSSDAAPEAVQNNQFDATETLDALNQAKELVKPRLEISNGTQADDALAAQKQAEYDAQTSPATPTYDDLLADVDKGATNEQPITNAAVGNGTAESQSDNVDRSAGTELLAQPAEPNNAAENTQGSAGDISAPMADKPNRTLKQKSNTLLTTLRDLGGVSINDKLDVTGEDKGFAPGGYNQIFRNNSRQSLKGHIESGTLDDYLPPAMRLSSQTQNSDAFDSTEAYDYLAERIRNGEKVIPYDTEQEINASKYYQEDGATAQSDIAEVSELFNEDEINEQLRIASGAEREAATQARQFDTGSQGSIIERGTGNQAAEQPEPKTISTQASEREGVRPLLESLVKRRAAANQLGKSKPFDAALQLAKDFMAGNEVKPAKFKNASTLFKNDKALSDTFNALHELAKAPAKEAKNNINAVIESYKGRIDSAKNASDLHELAREIQDDTNLSDSQAQMLDDFVFDAQDKLDIQEERRAEGADRVERRVEENTRKSVNEMTPEEMRRALLVDDLTGIGNRRAYDESVKKPIQVSIDADGLKWVNDNLGHESGDILLQAIGEALGRITEDSYHISGDEFVVQANSDAVATDVMDAVNELLANATVEGVNSNGDKVTLKGIGISYGIAKDLKDAENKLQQHKSEREQSGHRSGRGEQPANATISSQSSENNQDNATGETDLLGQDTSKQQAVADAEREKDAKHNSGKDNQDTFNLTGSNSEADQAASAGARPLFSRSNKTNTEAFKKWFGGSKVVDAGGKPLIVYHGTVNDFNIFDYDKIGTQGRAEGAGVYFTNNKSVAKGYGKPIEVFLSIEKPLAYDAKPFAKSILQKIIKRVAEIESERDGMGIGDGFLSNFGDVNYEGLNSVLREATNLLADDETAIDQLSGIVGSGVNPEVVNRATQEVTGYDGIIAKGFGNQGDESNTIYVAFFPEQVKSATSNNGDFDANNLYIRFSKSNVTGGMTKSDVEKILKPQIDKLKNITDVRVVQNQFEIPKLEKALSRYTADKSEKNLYELISYNLNPVEGAYQNNVIYIVADSLKSEKRALKVFKHEVTHLSVEQMLETSQKGLYKKLTNQITALDESGDKYIRKIGKLVDNSQPGLSKESKAKEILAFIAERGDELKDMGEAARTVWQRFLDGIKAFYKLVFDANLTDRDVRDIVSMSHRYAAGEDVYLTNIINGEIVENKIEDGDLKFLPTDVETSFSRKQVTVDSRDNWLFRRDDLGNIQLAPTGKAYDFISNITQNIANKANFGMASPELRRQIRHFKTDMQKALDVAENVAHGMQKMTPEDRALVSDVVEDMLKTGTVPPQHVLDVAANMQSIMDTQTDELVKLGMLNKDAAERWRGKYLPRFYNREQDPALSTLGQKLLRTALPIRGLGGGSLKGRGLYKEINVRELDNWEVLGWEVRDTLWKKNRQGKLELVDSNKVRENETVMIWRDYTPAERESMGENRDAMFRFVMGYTAMQNDIALGRLFDGIASNQEWTRSRPSEGYTKVPDSEIAETGGVKKYGNLAGLYVRDDIMQHISQYEQSSNLVKYYRKALSFWKAGKTVLNPVSHMNNMVSNLTMAHFAGVSYWETHKYISAIRDFVNNAPMIQEAKDVGLMTGDITRAELIAEMPDDIKAMMNSQDSKITKSAKATYNVLTFGLTKPMSKAYRFEDDFFKYLIYKEARANGVSPDNAVDYATKYIFNYDDLPKTARLVRDAAIPFFAYTYKAVPALAYTAFNYPWRFAAPAAAIYGLNALAYGLIAGDDDDDLAERFAKGKELEAEERKNLPPWMQGKSALGTEKTVRLGTDEKTGLPIYMDISRFMPGGDMFDIAHGDFTTLPAPITPSNPVLTTIAALMPQINKDMFTGKDIIDKNDTPAEAAKKRASWLIKQISPAIAPTGYHAEKLLNAGALMADTTINIPFVGFGDNVEYTGFGKDGLPVQPKYAAMNVLGVKAKPTDLELSAEISQGQDNSEIKSIKAEIRQAARLLDKGAISQRAYDKTEADGMRKIDDIINKQ